MGASAGRPTEDRSLQYQREELSECEEDECAVCLSGLDRAPTFQLAECGHCFHSLCLASALQVSPLCPLCRQPVSEDVALSLVQTLFASFEGSSSGAASALAAELLTELRARGPRTIDAELNAEETIAALQRAVQQRDDSKIPYVAALLQAGEPESHVSQPIEVRVAAVAALRKLVPAFPVAWPGWQPVLQLLTVTASSSNLGEEPLRLAAVQALREVARPGDPLALPVAQQILASGSVGLELLLAAGSLLQTLAVQDDADTVHAALLALGSEDHTLRGFGAAALRKAWPQNRDDAALQGLALLTKPGAGLPEVRQQALELLGQLSEAGEPLSLAAAGLALECEQDESVVLAALRSLTMLGRAGAWCSSDAMNGLLHLVIEPRRSANLRVAALEALPRLAQRGHLPAASAAATCLADDDAALRNGAAQALRQLLQRDVELEELLLPVASHYDPDVCKVALEFLGMTSSSGGRGEALLLQCRGSSDAGLAGAAERALKRLPLQL